jgi:hypothetical protein
LPDPEEEGGLMDLAECRFYYAGEEMNFVVFSEGTCRTIFMESIRLLPIMGSQGYAYAIQPGADSQWVVAVQTNGKKMDLRVFLRSGEKFLEHPPGEFPKELREIILECFPNGPLPLALSRPQKGPRRLRPRKDVPVPCARRT